MGIAMRCPCCGDDHPIKELACPEPGKTWPIISCPWLTEQISEGAKFEGLVIVPDRKKPTPVKWSPTRGDRRILRSLRIGSK